MNTSYYRITFASTYGSGAYDSSNYNGSGTTASSGTTGVSGSGGGTLSTTGIAVLGVVSLAAVILLVAMAVRIWKRPSSRAASDEVQE